MGEFSLKEKDLQSLDGGLPPRGAFRPEQKCNRRKRRGKTDTPSKVYIL